MLTVNKIIHNYIDIQNQSYNKTIQTNNIPTIHLKQFKNTPTGVNPTRVNVSTLYLKQM